MKERMHEMTARKKRKEKTEEGRNNKKIGKEEEKR